MAATQVGRASRRLPLTSRRSSRSRRAGGRLWTLLNAQALIQGTTRRQDSDSATYAEDDYQRFAAAPRGY
jgi:metal-dependent amidase/aminoacylase/carboxypeptidase family protein